MNESSLVSKSNSVIQNHITVAHIIEDNACVTIEKYLILLACLRTEDNAYLAFV